MNISKILGQNYYQKQSSSSLAGIPFWPLGLLGSTVSLLVLWGNCLPATATEGLSRWGENQVQSSELEYAQSLPILTPSTPVAVEKLNKGLEFIQQGKLNEAIALFREAAKLDPRLAPAHYNLGLALRQQGKLQPAAD
ncbi:MAG: tetratricopeptide repeat protein, partial [Moorea sp. SIO2B7]|nr:tetratricopeptide repeat protein [Moorena sp. SIO2B7]